MSKDNTSKKTTGAESEAPSPASDSAPVQVEKVPEDTKPVQTENVPEETDNSERPEDGEQDVSQEAK